jgi:preprotein translocase subunit YajC
MIPGLQTGGGGLALILQFAVIIAIFYFLLILPQRKEQKRHREMVAALRPGDRVATTGGLIGEIMTVKDEVVTLKTGEAKVTLERAKVARLMNPPADVK